MNEKSKGNIEIARRDVPFDSKGEHFEHERLSSDDEFVLTYPDLTFRLHYTAGMQELRRGSGKPNPKNSVTLKYQNDNTVILRRADELLSAHLVTMSELDSDATVRRLLNWTNGMPPTGSDFSAADRSVIDSFNESPLVSLYREYLPQ